MKKKFNAGIEPATSSSAAGHHYHIATASGIDCTHVLNRHIPQISMDMNCEWLHSLRSLRQLSLPPHRKFMVGRGSHLTLQPMARTNHKFPRWGHRHFKQSEINSNRLPIFRFAMRNAHWTLLSEICASLEHFQSPT